MLKQIVIDSSNKLSWYSTTLSHMKLYARTLSIVWDAVTVRTLISSQPSCESSFMISIHCAHENSVESDRLALAGAR